MKAISQNLGGIVGSRYIADIATSQGSLNALHIATASSCLRSLEFLSSPWSCLIAIEILHSLD